MDGRVMMRPVILHVDYYRGITPWYFLFGFLVSRDLNRF